MNGSALFFICRWYIHKQWRVLKDLNIPHPKPSIFKVGNFGDTARDFEAVRCLITVQTLTGGLRGHICWGNV